MCLKFIPQIEAMNVGTAMIAAQPEIFRTASFCCRLMTARLAWKMLARTSRWVAISSSTRWRWSSTSRRWSRSRSGTFDARRRLEDVERGQQRVHGAVEAGQLAAQEVDAARLVAARCSKTASSTSSTSFSIPSTTGT